MNTKKITKTVIIFLIFLFSSIWQYIGVELFNYDIDNLKSESFHGEVKTDYYGRLVPKPVHSSISAVPLRKYHSDS